jgi:hypothetical protein
LAASASAEFSAGNVLCAATLCSNPGESSENSGKAPIKEYACLQEFRNVEKRLEN